MVLQPKTFPGGFLKTNAASVLSIRLPLDASFLPVSTSFIEKASLAFGFGEKEAMALTLATEEIFSYLCKIGGADQTLEMECSDGRFYVQADFSCPFEDFEMQSFNITESVSVEDESSLEGMGLLLASRFVDRLQIARISGKRVLLRLIKEKSYPEAQAASPPDKGRPMSHFAVRGPDPETLKLFVQRVQANYPVRLFPKDFRFPGKVVDMVEGGRYGAALAVDAEGRLGGGIFWYWWSRKTVECFGPFLFGQEPGSPMAEMLLEACIGAIAKTQAWALVFPFPAPDLPRQHFEVLGTLTRFDQKGEGTPITAYFRQMQEDLGTVSWCHPELEPFLRREYGRLALPRDIHPVQDQGEVKSFHSVFSAEFDRSQSMVTLLPLHTGKDARENLDRHLKLFEKESIRNVLFVMDLGVKWHADLAPALSRTGFTPRMVIPYGGEGDLIFFQLGSPQS
jgi:anti-sigma regulatory factor (Ser/Thr protein kinase)